MVETVSPTVEGSLDIRCTNWTDEKATPRYNIFFLRYGNFKNGAQKPNPIVGTGGLEHYLIELGFTAENTKNWIKQIREMHSVSIPNVMMPKQRLAAYGL